MDVRIQQALRPIPNSFEESLFFTEKRNLSMRIDLLVWLNKFDFNYVSNSYYSSECISFSDSVKIETQ